jgi:tetratricopeptide (TPR) repeat protein
MIRTRHFTLLIFILLLSLAAEAKRAIQIGQPGVYVDSLLSAIASQPDDSFKVISLISSAKELYNNSNYAEAIKLSEESLSIAKRIDYSLGEAEAYFLMARANNKLNKSATALELFNESQRAHLQKSRTILKRSAILK